MGTVVPRSVLLLLLAGVLGACPHDAVASQTATGHPRRIDPFARFRDLKPEPPPLLPVEPAWQLTLPVPPSAGGDMDDEHVYVPLRDTGLAALDRETGVVVWFRPMAPAVAPVARGGRVFVATSGGIEALDAASGATQWSVPLSTAVRAPMLWDTGWLVAIVDPDQVVAFRASDGHVIWRRALGAPSLYAPMAAGEGALVLSLTDGRVAALALADGAPLWERTLPGTLSEPAVARDRVFVGSTDNSLYALDADSGEIEWRWRGGGDVIGAAADGELVYFASLDNIVRALNRGNGNQRWKKETGTRPVRSPRAFAGLVALPGLAPAVTVFAGKTGASLGTYVAPGDLMGPPLVDPALPPFRVTLVAITREGVVEASRSTGLMFREPAVAPLPALPGRALTRDKLP